jgi:ABC-type branched-subunit amino acid transport system substrate-binding protein
MKRISSLAAFAAAIGAAYALSAATAQEKAYKLGYIADLSGPMQDNYGPIVEGFEYYVKELNARGGINGVPVKVSVRDDGLDATKAASHTLELATSEGVNSVWGMSVTRTHLAVYQTAARNQIPAIAMFSGIKEVLPPSPLPFAYSAGHVFEVAGEVSGKLAAKMLNGKGKMICNSIEAPGGVAACQYAEGAAAAGGLETGTVLFPPTVTEFGAIAQRMNSMKPTIVVAHAGSGQNVGLIKALRGAGYNGPILLGSHGLNETPLINSLQGIGSLDKLQIVSRFASPDSPGKEIDNVRAAALKSGKNAPISTTTIMGWSLAKVMEASLRECGYPCPGTKLNGVLEKLKVDMGALMGGPVHFAPKDHYGTSWWRVYEYNAKEKKFLPVSEWLEASSTPKLRKQ